MLTKIQEELQHRKEVLAPKIATEYKAAIDDGDGAHDNPGIRDKGQEMEDNLMEIQRLENLLRASKAPSNEDNLSGRVDLGSQVELLDLNNNQQKIVKLVTSEEVQYTNNAVSVDSLLGKLLINKGEGEILDLTLPNGNTKKYKILNIKSDSQ